MPGIITDLEFYNCSTKGRQGTDREPVLCFFCPLPCFHGCARLRSTGACIGRSSQDIRKKKKKLLSSSFTACVVLNSIHKSSELGCARRAGALSSRVCLEQKALDVLEPSAPAVSYPSSTNPAIKKMALSHFTPISALQNANIAER